MLRSILTAAILIPALLACGDDDPADPGTGDDNGDSPNPDLVIGTGTRYQSTDGRIEVASVDTVYRSSGNHLSSSGTFSTSISSWIWDHEILENEIDVDSIAVHYEVLEGEIDLEAFVGDYDTAEDFSSDAWSNVQVAEEYTLGVGETVRIVLRRP